MHDCQCQCLDTQLPLENPKERKGREQGANLSTWLSDHGKVNSSFKEVPVDEGVLKDPLDQIVDSVGFTCVHRLPFLAFSYVDGIDQDVCSFTQAIMWRHLHDIKNVLFCSLFVLFLNSVSWYLEQNIGYVKDQDYQDPDKRWGNKCIEAVSAFAQE